MLHLRKSRQSSQRKTYFCSFSGKTPFLKQLLQDFIEIYLDFSDKPSEKTISREPDRF